VVGPQQIVSANQSLCGDIQCPTRTRRPPVARRPSAALGFAFVAKSVRKRPSRS
jgi:hypothetical protein